MQLISLPFFAGFALSLAIYYLFPAKYRYLLLLTYSCIFIFLSTPVAFPFVVISSVTVWVAARKRTKIAVVLCIVFNVLLLAVTKYYGFAITNINRVIEILGVSNGITMPEIIAPIGISFYTLSMTGYLLDVYWGQTEPSPSLLKTMLYIGYYPQLTSGPVTRFSDVSRSLFEGKCPTYENVTFGAQRILWGVFKKIVIAERAGMIVNTVYGDAATYNGFFIPVAASLFVVQLYSDFSGCMDIILGVSECYGIVLPENFRAPFLSQSVREFWQRWHITLGEWFRDYIMYPLQKSSPMSSWIINLRKKTKNKTLRNIPGYICMLAVWLLIGIWHGGAWKYILGMGLWFWSIIVFSEITKPLMSRIKRKLKIDDSSPLFKALGYVRVFILVAIGNMFFRMTSFTAVFSAVKQTFTHWNPEVLVDGSLLKLGVNGKNMVVLIIAVIIMAAVSVLGNKKSVRARLALMHIAVRWLILLALLWCVVVFGIYGPGYNPADFIYGGF